MLNRFVEREVAGWSISSCFGGVLYCPLIVKGARSDVGARVFVCSHSGYSKVSASSHIWSCVEFTQCVFVHHASVTVQHSNCALHICTIQSIAMRTKQSTAPAPCHLCTLQFSNCCDHSTYYIQLYSCYTTTTTICTNLMSPLQLCCCFSVSSSISAPSHCMHPPHLAVSAGAIPPPATLTTPAGFQ